MPRTLQLDVTKNGVLQATIDLLEDTSAMVDRSSGKRVKLADPSKRGAIRLGKDPKLNDIPCEHPSVSQLHCVLQLGFNPMFDRKDDQPVVDEDDDDADEPSYVHLFDVGSSNGTFLVGSKEPVKSGRHVALSNGMMFRLAASSRIYRVHWRSGRPQPEVLADPAGASRKRPREEEEERGEKHGADSNANLGSDSDEDSGADGGPRERSTKVKVSYSKYMEHKERVEAQGRRRDEDEDGGFDQADLLLRSEGEGGNYSEMSFARLQRLETALQKALQEESVKKSTTMDDEAATKSYNRRRSLEVQLLQVGNAMQRLRNHSAMGSSGSSAARRGQATSLPAPRVVEILPTTNSETPKSA